jgi:ABC-type cobalamin/Fe3+-siderophores transport system ATPase subunit
VTRLLETTALVCGYGARRVVDAGAMALGSGETAAIIGLNGAGKSTLLRTLCAQLAPLRGEVLVRGISVASLSPRERAKLVAYLPQQQELDPSLSVEDLVRLGRTPYLGRFGRFEKGDLRAVGAAIDLCGLAPLASSRLTEISGGERQRARLAMIVAQEAPLVLLDEPTTHLDMAQRFALHGLVDEMRRARGSAFAIVVHSVADAERFGDSIVLIEEGRAASYGPSMRAEARRALIASAHVPEEWIY